MPITFGSVGDIISTVLLIKALVKALDDSQGSGSEYCELIRELWSLEVALLEVENLSHTHPTVSSVNTLRQAALQCRPGIDDFLKKIQKYHTSLRTQGSGNVIRDVWWKVQWRVTFKDDLAQFRAEVNSHASSITLLMLSSVL